MRLPSINFLFPSFLASILHHVDAFTPLHSPSFRVPSCLGVEVHKVGHKLTFVDSINDIGPKANPFLNTTVPALELENNVGVRVKCMAEGANMVGLTIKGEDYGTYIWDNIEGAAYYGANSNAFPLKRGLILHGGVRFGAVTAEHGLYYDIDWNMTTTSNGEHEKSIVMTIVDNKENRQRAFDREGQFRATDMEGFSEGGFTTPYPFDGPMGKYPVTDLVYTLTVTLRDDEDFVRLNMKVENPTYDEKKAEAWLPMTFPIVKNSQILSRQKMRWKRDDWCFPALPNIVDWQSPHMKKLGFDKPLTWPTGNGGIFYDFPKMDGNFHGINNPEKGNGIVFVAPGDKSPHYTKLWGWGDDDLFDRKEALKQNPPLAAGRPYKEYYEPWSSGFTFGFFNPSSFKPRTINSWEVALFPIKSGLKGTNSDHLCDIIERKINRRNITESLSGVVVKSMDDDETILK